MTKNDKSLTPEQEQFVHFLLLGQNMPDAAKSVGVSESTGRRWYELPQLQDYYQRARADISLHVREQIKQLTGKAITALSDSLESEVANVRLKAAQLVLDRVAPIEPMQSGDATGHGPQLDLSGLSAEQLDQLHGWLREVEVARAEQEEKKIVPLRKRG